MGLSLEESVVRGRETLTEFVEEEHDIAELNSAKKFPDST
jgi:hypothetical protein